VTKDNQGARALLGNMHTNAVCFDDAVPHLGRRGLTLAVDALLKLDVDYVPLAMWARWARPLPNDAFSPAIS
jgi:hypothetical protein